MRFLKIGQHGELKLTEDLTSPPAPYAILSHTWGADGDEVTFDDMRQNLNIEKPGYNKLRFCANQARTNRLEYVWIDTCCINKANLAELDEAIRSMFRWYQNAERCYVYLSDITAGNALITQPQSLLDTQFRSSKWFTRGWTLQELLAPKSVEFFSQDGQPLGSKRTLERQISEITGIPVAALRGEPLSNFSVDERLQWAEPRKTKKVEDQAYSLFGIFNLFMNTMYGEGDNALRRLRKEIGSKYLTYL
jgi:hypothetical protein